MPRGASAARRRRTAGSGAEVASRARWASRTRSCSPAACRTSEVQRYYEHRRRVRLSAAFDAADRPGDAAEAARSDGAGAPARRLRRRRTPGADPRRRDRECCSGPATRRRSPTQSCGCSASATRWPQLRAQGRRFVERERNWAGSVARYRDVFGRARAGGNMNLAGLRIGLVGPMPPPEGGMANQTRQLGELLQREGAKVTVVPSTPPTRPRWIDRAARRPRRVPSRALRRSASGACAGDVRRLSHHGQLRLVVAPVRGARGVDRAHSRRPVGGQLSRRRGRDVSRPFRRCRAEDAARRERAGGAVRIPAAGLRRGGACRAKSCPTSSTSSGSGRAGRVRPQMTSPPGGRAEPRADLRHPDGVAGIRARARAVPDARLTVAGAGPERRALRTLAAELGIADAVDFCGRAGPRPDGGALSIGVRRAQSEPRRQHAEFGPGGDGERRAGREHRRRWRAVHPEERRHRAPGRGRTTTRRWPTRCGACSVNRNWRTCLRDAALADVQQYTWPRVRQRWADVYASVLAGARVAVRTA